MGCCASFFLSVLLNNWRYELFPIVGKDIALIFHMENHIKPAGLRISHKCERSGGSLLSCADYIRCGVNHCFGHIIGGKLDDNQMPLIILHNEMGRMGKAIIVVSDNLIY